MKFRYIPAIGKRVKLRLWKHYGHYEISVWAWLRVVRIDPDDVVMVEVLNGDRPTGRFIAVRLDEIERPIGWEERYTIYCAPEDVDKVLSWLPRGIGVRQSHDLGNAGARVFQPLDNSAQPHWQYPELTDAIPPEETNERIRIVKIEREDPLRAPDGRWFSQLTPVERRRAKSTMAKSGWKVFYRHGFYQAERETVVKDWSTL